MNKFLQITTELRARFITHLSAMNSDIPLEKMAALWQDIATSYNEPQRAYHSLQHIQQLFAQFERIEQRLYEPHIIALALYYHDVIYEPTRSDNERKSAECAVDKLSTYLAAKQCQHIYALIMMTANHQIDDIDKDSNKAKKSDAAYLLDMDLSILGTPWSEYQQYAQAVREEYAHITKENYRAGRIAVLEKLLTHPRLYLTEYYHTRLEEQARENIKREIALLHAP